MILLAEKEGKPTEDNDVPLDIFKRNISYRELCDLIDLKAINQRHPLFRYESATKTMQVVSTPLRAKQINFERAGIELDSDSQTLAIIASGIAKIDYQELHFINGGKPLSTVSFDIYLKDGGKAHFQYQIVGYWRG